MEAGCEFPSLSLEGSVFCLSGRTFILQILNIRRRPGCQGKSRFCPESVSVQGGGSRCGLRKCLLRAHPVPCPGLVPGLRPHPEQSAPGLSSPMRCLSVRPRYRSQLRVLGPEPRSGEGGVPALWLLSLVARGSDGRDHAGRARPTFEILNLTLVLSSTFCGR